MTTLSESDQHLIGFLYLEQAHLNHAKIKTKPLLPLKSKAESSIQSLPFEHSIEMSDAIPSYIS
jgi:hypothetical protein